MPLQEAKWSRLGNRVTPVTSPITVPVLAGPKSCKTALNALTVFYAHALAGDGIKVTAPAPGLRRTDLNATAASDGDPAEAAGAVRLALLPDDGPSGRLFSWDGTPVPW